MYYEASLYSVRNELSLNSTKKRVKLAEQSDLRQTEEELSLDI